MTTFMIFESEGSVRNGKRVATRAKTARGIWEAGQSAYSQTPASLCGYQLDAIILEDGRRIERRGRID